MSEEKNDSKAQVSEEERMIEKGGSYGEPEDNTEEETPPPEYPIPGG